jgi:hypothetical protein
MGNTAREETEAKNVLGAKRLNRGPALPELCLSGTQVLRADNN